MSNFHQGGGGSGGGGRYSGGRGGSSRGRGRARGRSDHHGGAAGGGGPKAMLKPCGHFAKGTCANGPNCSYAHVVKLHASLEAAGNMPQSQNQQHNNGYSNYNNQPKKASVSSIAIWQLGDAIKIFTGSHDGYWRLWNTQNATFVKEFEHNMSGKVEVLKVASNFLFVGFEAVSLSLPGDARVGMIHAWNLQRPTDPPLEFHMHALMPYAHAACVTELLIVGADVIVSGCHYGVIKVWNFDAAASRFVLKQTLNGHARGISGLIMVDKLLWSSSLDGSIRLWDIEKGECQYVITKNTKAKDGQATVGHVGAVTGLLLCPMPGAGTFVLSSSLDGTIKAWNGANGECVVSHEHQAGVVSMALSQDKSQHPIILIGLDNGNIMIRNLVQTQKAPAFALILTLSSYFSVGHSGAVRSVAEGPHQTFYTGGQDGQLLVLQITDDLGI